MAIIRLHGNLERFGKQFNIDVKTPSEAIRALSFQIKNFRQFIENGSFRVRIRKADLCTDDVNKVFHGAIGDKDVFHIVPVINGAKDLNLTNIIIGAVMIVAAFYTGGASIAAWGSMSTGLAVAGAGMVLGGVAGMLSPSFEQGDSSSSSSTGNQYFSSLDNRVAQGAVVPLIYGEIKAGSIVLSQETETV